jgi:predicted HAD superfamily Cof-like phosphohydrolase
MNDPVTILTAALLHAQGRFLFYANNHQDKAANFQRQLDETPAGLDPDTVAHLQAQITDTLTKAEDNRSEVAAIGMAIRQATGLDATYVRVVPLDLLGAAMRCVTQVAPGGEVQRQLREIVFGPDTKAVRLPDTTPAMALHAASQLPLNFFTRASLDPAADHMTQLIAFHDTYAVPMHELGNTDPNFGHMTDERVAMRLDLIAEEVIELFEDGFGLTIAMQLMDGSAVGTKSLSEHLYHTGNRNGVEVVDALGDIVYLCYGLALELGYDLRAVIREIHASNLTKLGADGVPVMREDGKVLKGPGYMRPNIAAALGFIRARS